MFSNFLLTEICKVNEIEKPYTFLHAQFNDFCSHCLKKYYNFNMRILVTGATGFIGKHLVQQLKTLNHEVIVLTRNKEQASKILGETFTYLEWDHSSKIDLKKEKAIDIVINLAGENIASKRWNKDQKERIYSSRVDVTRKLIESLKSLKKKPDLLINASAIGYYGNSNIDLFDEESKPGNGFLPMVIHDWENVVKKNQDCVNRWAILRIGMVLGKGGGTIEKLLPLFNLGVGGPLGEGSQPISWIHVKDLVKMFIKIIEDKQLSGVFNATTEFSVTNSEFSNVLSRLLQKPALLKLPAFALKTVLGERSSVLLEGAKVIPKRFKEMKFHYNYPTVEKALKEVVSTTQKH